MTTEQALREIYTVLEKALPRFGRGTDVIDDGTEDDLLVRLHIIDRLFMRNAICYWVMRENHDTHPGQHEKVTQVRAESAEAAAQLIFKLYGQKVTGIYLAEEFKSRSWQ
jgi:hypothetical protein